MLRHRLSSLRDLASRASPATITDLRTGVLSACRKPEMREVGKKVLSSLGLLGSAGRIRRRGAASRLGRRWTARRQRRRTLRLYRQFVPAGGLCFDVGANRGDSTHVFLELGARVVAVEPQQENLDFLSERFASRAEVSLVAAALGAHDGAATLLVCNHSDCSSLSPEYVEAVTASGRLSRELYRWERRQEVELTTLDRLMDRFGLPDFCKIDVEGFEWEVLQGCRRPIPALSFEFTPEMLEPAFRCLRRLDELGRAEFNLSPGRQMRLVWDDWVGLPETLSRLESLPRVTGCGPGGDLYARFRESNSRRAGR